MKKTLSLILLAFAPVFIFSQASTQPKDEPAFGIKFGGFLKTDIIWDSRQTEALREGHFLLYPKNKLLDNDGDDINARANFNFLSIQSRLKGDIKGPDALGAKTSGYLEAEFFGTSDADMNGFRLRHAIVKLNWKTTELMVGQYWHPMFITSCYPEVVSFNTGAPFTVFSRNPQVRLTKDLNRFRIILAALSQVDFKSPGPDGVSSKYLRNAAVPSFNANLEYSKKDAEAGKEFLIGVAGNFKRLIPRITTVEGYKTSEGISSISGMAYFKAAFPDIVFKLAGFYGQNMATDYTMMGGYGEAVITDTVFGYPEYYNFKTFSAWTEIMTTGKKMQGGLFLAYTKNLGATDENTLFIPAFYNKVDNMAYLYRISPRFVYNAGKFRIAPEIEYTVAGFGTKNLTGAMVDDPEAIANFRFLVGVFYFF